jgi:hypothetical protein
MAASSYVIIIPPRPVTRSIKAVTRALQVAWAPGIIRGMFTPRPAAARRWLSLGGAVDPWALWLGVVLVLATAVLFLMQAHERAGIWWSAPLDDTFIHFQYAKQLARGKLLQFNDGDPASTGATSLLYLFVLAPGWLLGFKGAFLLRWAWLVNGLLHVAGSVAVFGMIKRLTGSRGLAHTAQAAYLLSGPLLWGVYSNMEVGLFSSLVMLSLWGAVALEQDGSACFRRRLLWAGSFLALARPEGALMAGGLSLWLLWRHWAGPEPFPPAPLRVHLRRCAPLLWPLAAGAAMILFFLIVTGRIGTNASIKSHVGFLVGQRARYLEVTVAWLPMTLQILLEKWPGFLQPLTTTLALGGLVMWVGAGSWRRPGTGGLVLGWLTLLTLFYSFFIARRDHFDRYYLPYLGLNLLCMWWGLGWLRRIGTNLARGAAVIAGVLIVFMLPDTLFWSRRFGDNCRDLAHQHFRAATWVRDHTPRDARIAVNDAGAIPYLSERYSYDIVGLVSNAFYRKKNHMPKSNAPVWEQLERLPHRPAFVVAYPEWITDLPEVPIFKPVMRFPLTGRSIVANDVKFVWKLEWEKLLDGDAPPPGVARGRVLDRLDVADLDCEEAHHYRRIDRDVPEGLVSYEEHDGKWLVDGGRMVRAGESFVLRGGKAGVPGLLILRTKGSDKLDVEVSVDGQQLGRWKTDTPAGLGAVSFTIPAAQMRAGALAFRIAARAPYTSFHWWLMQ